MSFPAEEDILRPPALQPFEKYAECTVGRESQLYGHLAQALVPPFQHGLGKGHTFAVDILRSIFAGLGPQHVVEIGLRTSPTTRKEPNRRYFGILCHARYEKLLQPAVNHPHGFSAGVVAGYELTALKPCHIIQKQ